MIQAIFSKKFDQFSSFYCVKFNLNFFAIRFLVTKLNTLGTWLYPTLFYMIFPFCPKHNFHRENSEAFHALRKHVSGVHLFLSLTINVEVKKTTAAKTACLRHREASGSDDSIDEPFPRDIPFLVAWKTITVTPGFPEEKREKEKKI